MKMHSLVILAGSLLAVVSPGIVEASLPSLEQLKGQDVWDTVRHPDTSLMSHCISTIFIISRAGRPHCQSELEQLYGP